MRKIDGKIIQQAVEIGARYIADDGEEFVSKWECERYEAQIKKKEKDKHFLAVYYSIMESKVIEGLVSYDERIHFKRFETKEEFLETFKTLGGYNYGGTDHYAYYGNHVFPNDELLPEFPANFIIKFSLKEYEDSRDIETFNFVEANEYIKKLQDKIDAVKEASK